MKPNPSAKQGQTSRGGKSKRAGTGTRDADPATDIRDAIVHLKRERIIAEAVQLFYTNGFGKTTLEEVADQMNVTKPFIYSHFQSKNDLLAEICSRGIRASLVAVDRVISLECSATDKLYSMVTEFTLAVIENQAHVAIYNRDAKYLSADSAEEIKALRREFDGKVTQLVANGVDAGEFTVNDVHLTSLAIGALGSWTYVWYRPDGRLSADEVASEIGELALAMVHAKPHRKRPRSKA